MVAGEGPIWAALRAKSPDRFERVRELAKHAADLLILVRDTFPTYTLHSAQHAENVVKLMGELLGPRSDELNGLEAAMLILAAYYHDIGMVYSEDELKSLERTEEFARFLDSNPEAFLKVKKNAGVATKDVLEDFCRARHADRVYVHLNRIPGQLKWGSISLVPALGELCRSHNLPTSELKSDSLDRNFLGRCDLRFCAIMLRLADILDFDSSRSPRAVYEHLKLAERADPQKELSDREWRKHLHSDGFEFPPDRGRNYLLKFIAGPDEPAVEYDMRHFLDVIEAELSKCRTILDFCSPRWQDLSLPGGVDRQNIVPDGYKYGDFKFELDRTSVLELFMGERLYKDPYVFVRELLQNSIDAVRLRQALHSADGFDPTVAVTAWKDDGGFVWVRIDDPGTGMDEEIIKQYFLRVGRSYYRSADVQADLLRKTGARQEFVAISRFGIGILSCFTLADQVEVSTRRILRDGSLAKALRLSVSRAEDFFILQEAPNQPKPMPARFANETSYREPAGTSIALRINPARTEVTPELIAKQIRDYVICPPVPVTFNGQPENRLPREMLAQPWLSEPTVIESQRATIVRESSFDFHLRAAGNLSEETTRLLDDRVGFYGGAVRVIALPLDITAASSTPLLQGQLVALAIDAPDLAADDKFYVRGPARDLLRFWTPDKKQRLPAAVISALGQVVNNYKFYFSTVDSEIKIILEQRLDDDALQSFQVAAEHYRGMAETASGTAGEHRAEVAMLFDSLGRSTLRDFNRKPYLMTRFDVPRELITNDDMLFYRGNPAAFWSHNGIAIPTGYESRKPAKEGSVAGVVPLQFSGSISSGFEPDLIFVGVLAFADRLRPDVSVSRDQLIGVPFALHSALQLSVRRAASAYIGGPYDELARRIMNSQMINVRPSDAPVLNSVLDDPLLSDNAWYQERILPVLGGPEPEVSVMELRERAARGVLTLPNAYDFLRGLWSPPDPVRYSDTSFYGYLIPVLGQTALDLAWRASPGESEGKSAELVVRSGRAPEITEGLGFFPPMFFVPYEDDITTLKDSKYYSVNAYHPLAAWMIENAVTLGQEVPALFTRLTTVLQAGPSGDRPAARVNDLLDEITNAIPAERPPAEAYVRSTDEGRRWGS